MPKEPSPVVFEDLRLVISEDIPGEYLTLRFHVLGNQKNWTLQNACCPSETRDEYDSRSIGCGIYEKHNLVASVRLVIANTIKNLPSGEYLPSAAVRLHLGDVAEISRLMVSLQCRHRGLAKLLTRRCLVEAKRRRIKNVFITLRETPRRSRFLCDIGFKCVNHHFRYSDSKLAANEFAASYQLNPRSAPFSLEIQRQLDLIASQFVLQP